MMQGDTRPLAEAGDLVGLILGASDAGTSMPPISDSREFALDEAYRVSGRIMRARIARGEKPIGWKIGFTNRHIWNEYGVHAPIWGPMYDSTLAMQAADGPACCDTCTLVEPRIEPEIVFRLRAAPRKGMDERELLGFIDAVGHGVEIVQSVFPGWRFQAADTVAAFAMHGSYYCGPLAVIPGEERAEWLTSLAAFEIRLMRNGVEIDRGQAANVLGGPLAALRHFVDGFDEMPFGRGLLPGDLVTTGTLTRAFPVERGQLWETELAGLPLPGLTLQF